MERKPMPETLIQSQQVTLTGPVDDLEFLLQSLRLDARDYGCTVTLTPTSVPDATVGVTQDSQQNPRQRSEAHVSREPIGFEDWWFTVGQGIDPDVEEVPWYDKRKGLAAEAYLAGQSSVKWSNAYKASDAQGSVTEQSQQKSRQAHEEWERKLASAQTEVASEMKKRLEGLFITLGIGDYPGDWWAAMEKMAEAIRAQKHLATFASERYDKILELERRLADAQGSVTEPPTEAEPRDDGPCDCDWVCVCPKG